jgi:hypothetical protein
LTEIGFIRACSTTRLNNVLEKKNQKSSKEFIHLTFSLLSKGSGFDKVANIVQETLWQHC